MNDNELKPILVETIPGQAVVFNDLLLHGGALNKGELSRVSLEFTMLLRNS
jgi:ectoine hydroxylase-related dioxygenase (phytanoyl-CoA dioxygenase family)